MILPGFSFWLDGRKYTDSENMKAGNLSVTIRKKPYDQFGAIEWVLEFENIGDKKTSQITGLMDCDVLLKLKADEERFAGNRFTDDVASVFVQNGCGQDYSRNDAAAAREFRLVRNYICAGETQNYSNGERGRSSDVLSPFFDVNKGKEGYLIAVGWTGGWQASFERTKDGIHVQTGIRGLDFHLLPGEKIRTSSVLIMEYHEGQTEARNRMRRLIREVYAPFGKGKRPVFAPLAYEHFGGMPTNMMLERLEALRAHGIRFDQHWVDAGWQGDSTKPCFNCYTGDWALHTGEWFVNPNCHPDGMQEVVKKGEEMGMGLFLWFEPERMPAFSPLVRQHPDWFLEQREAGDSPARNVLLDLGNPQAWQACFDTLCGFIESLKIHVYRQDFNCDPMGFWQNHDEPGRKGITEIYHITGLYRLWDALLEKYPSLIIDNCSSGGRRIDIETLRRSFPFFRSDYYCNFNLNPDVTQSHNSGYSLYLPYTGSATKIKADRYAVRSGYSASLGINCWSADFQTMSESDLEMLRGFVDEYRSVRRFFSQDFYPIAAPMLEDSAWTAWQYHSPEENAGAVLAFRREKSPMVMAELPLQGLVPDAEYELTYSETGKQVRVSGKKLMDDGLIVEIRKKRDSELITYRRYVEEGR